MQRLQLRVKMQVQLHTQPLMKLHTPPHITQQHHMPPYEHSAIQPAGVAAACARNVHESVAHLLTPQVKNCNKILTTHQESAVLPAGSNSSAAQLQSADWAWAQGRLIVCKCNSVLVLFFAYGVVREQARPHLLPAHLRQAAA